MNYLKSMGLIAFCFLALTTSSCKKEEDLDTQILGKWKITSVKVAGQDVISLLIDVCEQDDVITIEAGGKGSTDTGKVKCDPSDPQSEPFTWTWKDKAAKKLLFSDPNFIELAITEITSSTIKADVVENGVTANFVLTKQ
jgi:Lipocalin-like domain